MQLERRLLQDLVENQINTRVHNRKQIEEFKKSINKFDVIRPIVIDENNVILAGHGLFNALKELGRESADCVVMHGLSDKDKKKLLLADNKIYSLGNDNYSAIEQILKEFGQSSDFEIPGYDSDILEELYGIRSVEQEVESGNTVASVMTEISVEGSEHPSLTVESSDGYTPSEPSERFIEARREAESRRFVVCPSCGEKIWL